MHKIFKKILSVMLLVWSFYAFFEAFLYLSHIRLVGIKSSWPADALSYSSLLEGIVGSLFLLIGAVAFIVSKNLDKYRGFIKISGVWTLFHGGLLIFLGLTQDYLNTFMAPSLYVWFPFYDQYLVIEGIALIGYSVIVYLYERTT